MVQATGAVAPNVQSYNSIISACGKAGQWEKAVDLLREMQTKDGLAPNAMTYNSAMIACGDGGQWDKVKTNYHTRSCYFSRSHYI